MAEQRLDTTISMTDKFSKTVADFEKKLYHTLKPVDKVNKSLERLGKAFQFKELGTSLNLLKQSSTDFFFNIRNIGQSFGYIKEAFVGVVHLLDKVTAKGDQLAKTSGRLGFTVEELQKFEYVADLAGVSSEQFTKGMKNLSDASYQAVSGQKEFRKAFYSLDIPLKKADGSLKSSQDLLLDLADRFAKTGEKELSVNQKIFAAQKLFGKSGVDLITVLNQGSAAIKEQMDELVDLGIIEEEDAKKSEAYRDSVSKLNRAIDHLSFTVAKDLFGPMTESVQYLTNYLKENRDVLVKTLDPFIKKIPEMTQVFIGALPGIIEAFEDVAGTVKWVVDFIGVKWPILLTVFSGVGIPLTLMIYSAVKSFLLLLNTVGRVAMFFKTAFTGSAKKASSAVSQTTQKASIFRSSLNRLKSAGASSVGVFKKLTSTLFRTGKSFDKVAVSAQKSSAVVTKSGNSAMFMSKKLMGALIALDAAGNVLEQITDKENERYKDVSGARKAGLAVVDFFKSIPVLGSFVGAAENLSVDKVDFGDMPRDWLSESMNLEDSDLFNAVSQSKTITTNNHSTIDVNFNGFPKNTEFKRHGYNDPSFGYSMSPAF